MSEDSSKHFRQFQGALERRLEKYSDLTSEENYKIQKTQVETLLALEARWKAEICKNDEGKRVYSAFITHIIHQRKNILDARPFFRERQTVFMRRIAPALRNGDWKKLSLFRINWSFIAWELNEFDNKPKKVYALAQQIADIRRELVEANLPLAITRARIFWSRTQKSHASFMDLISVCAEGLIAAVDKFVPPYTKVFASVASYRMLGNMIEFYSETMLHFWPSDRRKIYRANKFMSKHPHGAEIAEDMVTEVNREAPPRQLADESEIRSLMLAASTVSADAKVQRGESDQVSSSSATTTNISRYAAPETDRPDVKMESAESEAVLREAAKCLTLFERKLLRLRGVQVDLKLPVDKPMGMVVN